MPDGLMGYSPGATATPPFVPAGRPAGLGGGLFGGGVPYPVDPSMQQGLMRDAWRQFGLQLLANAQNPNIGQGLAAALASGRQAYAGGAEQAYQVGREQEQDALRRRAIESLAREREQDAERERRGAGEAAESAQQQAERVAGVLAELEQSDPERARGLRQIIALSGGKIPAEALGELMPQEEAAMTPYQQEQVRLAEERLGLQRARDARPAGGRDTPSGPSQTAILGQIGQLVRAGLSPEDAAVTVQRAMDEMNLQGGISAAVPPPVPGGGGLGARAATPPDRAEQPETGPAGAGAIESIVQANPQLAQGVQTMINRGATPEEILEKLESMGYGGR